MVTVDPGTAYGSPVQKFSKREPEGRGTIRTSHMLALADKAEEETMGPGRHEGALARKKIRKRIRNFESKLLPPISRVLAGLRQVNAWIFFGDRTLGTEKKKVLLDSSCLVQPAARAIRPCIASTRPPHAFPATEALPAGRQHRFYALCLRSLSLELS